MTQKEKPPIPNTWNEFEKQYGGLIAEAESKNGLPKGLLSRLLWMESRGRAEAVSPKGARGPAQFMGPTAREMGISDPHDPKQAIPGAARYLRKIKDQYLKTDDWAKVVGAYNAGHSTVADGWPLSVPRETRDYVRLVHGTDPWPDRDRDQNGRRPEFEALLNKVPVQIQSTPTVDVPPVKVSAPAVSLLAQGSTAPSDIGGPLTVGLAPKAAPASLPPPPEAVAPFQAATYFPVETQAANLVAQYKAGEIAYEKARADLTSAEKYAAALRETHVVPSVQAAREISQASSIYGPADWAVAPAKAVEDLQRVGASAEYAPRLLEAHGPEHYGAILSAIQQESEAERVMESMGFWQSLGYGILAGATDPTMALLNFSSAGAPAILRGGSIGLRIAKGAAFGAGAGAAVELPLQATQETRGYDEATFAILGSTFLGGLAGVPGDVHLRTLKKTLDDARDGTYIPRPDPGVFPLANPAADVPAIRVPAGNVPKPVASFRTEPSPLADLRLQQPAGEIDLTERPQPLTVEKPGSITIFPQAPVADGSVSFTNDILTRADLDAVSEKAAAQRLQALGAITIPEPPLRPEPEAAAAPQQALSIGDAATWVDPKTGAQRSGIITKLLDDGHAMVEDADGGKRTKVPLSAITEQDGGGFLPGSVGAAQVGTVDGAAVPYGQTTETWSSWGPKWLRFDPVGKLRNLNNPVLSWFSNAGEDGVGLLRDGTAARFSAEEIAERERVTREVALRRELDTVFSAVDAGKPRWGRAARRKDFEARILDYYEFGGHSNLPDRAEWERGLKALNDYFEGWRKRLQSTGVSYAAGLDFDRHYIPRIVHVRKFRELADEVGTGQVARLLAGAMEARYLHVNGKAIGPGQRAAFQVMADGYVRGVLRRGYWGDLIGLHGLPSDRPSIRAVVEAAPNMTPEKVDEVLKEIDKLGSGGDGPERFKHRFDFDMGHSVVVRDRNGRDRRIGMTELYVRSASDLAAMYGRQVSGHAALAEHMGIRSRADFEKAKLLAVERHQGNDRELRAGLQLMDYLYEGITGRPFEDDPLSAFNVWGRRLRDFNFIRLMNQVGFAQIAEFGRSISMHGWKAMMQQMPVIGDVFRMAKDGKLDNQLLRELEAMAGIGTHRFRSHLATVSDDTIDGTFGTGLDELLHKGKLLTSDISGMSFLTTMQQRMAGAAIAQNLANAAIKGADASRMIQSLGLTADDWAFVAREIKANASIGKGGRLHVLNYQQMDPEASNLLALALHRAVRRAVQENSLGNTLPFMHRTTGQLLMQFRGFGMGAVFKQTLQGLAQRDILTFQAFMFTTLAGGLSYVVQTVLNEPDPDKLEEKLALDRVAKAGFNRSGYMSMIPAVVDSAVTWGTAGSVPGFFNGRTTPGLGSDLVGGNPTVSLLNNAQRGLAAFPNAMFRDDYDYSRADLRAQAALLPIVGNAIGLRRAWAALGIDLPRESVDTAPDYFGASK